MPGASDKAAEAPRRVEASAAASADPWPHAAEVPSYAAVDDRELPSAHNAPYWSGVVRVSPSLDALYRALAPDTRIPSGAVVVEQHRTQDGASGPLYAMVKRENGFDSSGGDWEYLIVDAEGRITSRGALSYCARCHGDAAANHLFGPRVTTRRKLSGASTPEGVAAPQPEEDEGRAPEGASPTGSGGSQKPSKSRKKKH